MDIGESEGGCEEEASLSATLLARAGMEVEFVWAGVYVMCGGNDERVRMLRSQEYRGCATVIAWEGGEVVVDREKGEQDRRPLDQLLRTSW